MAQEQITLTLSDQRDVEFLNNLIDEGTYPSEDAAVLDFIAMQREDREEFELYLKETVLPRMDAMKETPDAFVSFDQLQQHLEEARTRRAERLG